MSTGKAAKTGWRQPELSRKSSGKRQWARSPQNSPHGSFLIGFNYFPTNCIFKSSPKRFLDLRIFPLLSGLGGLAWAGTKRQGQRCQGATMVPPRFLRDLERAFRQGGSGGAKWGGRLEEVAPCLSLSQAFPEGPSHSGVTDTAMRHPGAVLLELKPMLGVQCVSFPTLQPPFLRQQL